MRERPAQLAWPYLNPNSPLYQGLVFAGLGPHPGGYDFHDCSPYRNNGRLTNMDPATDWVWVPELGRWGLDFDGSNDTVEGFSVALSGSWTCSAWCYIAPGWTADFGATGGANYQIWLDVTAGPVWRLGIAGTAVVYGSTSADWRGTWKHCTWALDGTNCNFYVNGQPDGSSAVTANDTYVRIGATNTTGSKLAKGMFSDVMFHRRCLPSAEISALADPSNAMLSVGGCPLILPPRRTIFASAVGAPATNRRRRFLIGAAA